MLELRRRCDRIEHLGSDSGEHPGIQTSASPFVEQNLGPKREALAGDALLAGELVELPSVAQVRN